MLLEQSRQVSGVEVGGAPLACVGVVAACLVILACGGDGLAGAGVVFALALTEAGMVCM